ncbi:MAG TPA: hypothetical protein DCS20_04505 [Candidatus Yonathbacteria bacterium]|nr:hypothetical protein [Candidatus Yonathbacteria bacterium]
MKKIKNLKVVVGLLVAVAVVSGAVVFWPKSSQVFEIPTYTDTDYGFSFSAPQGYSASSFSDVEDTKTILLGSDTDRSSLQVFVSAFDEDIVLTVERINQEMPDLVVLDPQKVSAGEAEGVSFGSTNALDTESREVWFVYKGNLYQISAPINKQTSPELFDAIIKTWKWNE